MPHQRSRLPDAAWLTSAAAMALVLPLLAAAGAGDPTTQPTIKPHILPNGSIPLVVSEKTTRFTGPLLSDGTVNFVEALDALCRQGATKENNFSVVVLQVFGPSELSPKIRDRLLKRLDLDLPEKGDYFFNNDPEKAGVAHDELFAATTQPWTAPQRPKLAAWLGDNEKYLTRLADGARRCTHNYLPALSGSDPPTVAAVLLPNLGYFKRATYALGDRAMLRFGNGDFDRARSDIDAIAHLSRHVMHQPALISWLVGVACEWSAHIDIVGMARSGKLSARQAQQLLADVDAWPPRLDVNASIDRFERCMGLDCVQQLQRGDRLLGAVEYMSDSDARPAAPSTVRNQVVVADFNVVAAEINAGYDLMVDYMRRKTFAERCKIMEEEKVRVEKLGASSEVVAYRSEWFWGTYKQATPEEKRRMATPVVAKGLALDLVPALGAVCVQETRIATRYDLTRLVLALAAYQADKGAYPETLAVLTSDYLKAIPQDPFIDQPLKYHREGSGYVLYSVGPDMKDDGGDDKKDIVIRVP